MKWRKKLFKIVCLFMAGIFSLHCTTITTGKLITTEEKLNKSKILGYKYDIIKYEKPSIQDPTVSFKIEKSPLYEMNTVGKYEKVKKKSQIKYFFFTTLITSGILYLLTKGQDVKDKTLKLIGVSAYMGAYAASDAKGEIIKKIGQTEKIEKIYPSAPLENPVPVSHVPVEFEWDAGDGKTSFKTSTDAHGKVKVNLIDDLEITKVPAKKDTLNLTVKFMDKTFNKLEKRDVSMDPSLWLIPYTFHPDASQTGVYIYKDPSHTAAKLMTISQKKKMHIRDISDNWVKITIDDQEGWVPRDSGDILYVESEYMELTNPPFLETTVQFDDSDSAKPNGVLEGYENAKLIAYISNKKGKGRAMQVKLRLTSSNHQVILEKEFSIGTMSPGEEKKLEIPISASIDARNDIASLLIETKERNGNDAAPVRFNLRLLSIPLPEFSLRGIEINDGISGLANGNSNGNIENGETIELITSVQNKGRGEALEIKSALSVKNPEINVIKTETIIPRINSGKTGKTSFVFHVPRTFKEKVIKARVRFYEGRGACSMAKDIPLHIHFRIPKLSYHYEIFDGNSAQSNGNKDGKIQQGEVIELRIKIKNGGRLDAKKVKVNIKSASERVILSKTYKEIGKILPGAVAAPVRFIVNVQRKAKTGRIWLPITLSQKDFRAVESSIPFNIEKGFITKVPPPPITPPIDPPPVQSEPLIIIANPTSNHLTYDSDTLEVIGRAADDEEIKELLIKVNNRVWKKLARHETVSENKDKRSMDFNIPVFLRTGKNTIEISVVDNDGLTATKEIYVTRILQKAETWVVTIGINRYSHDKIPSLKYAVNDANEMARYFTDNLKVPTDHIITLTDEQATLTKMKNILGTQLKRKAQKNDTVIIFFSGHGSRELDPNNPDGDGFEKYLLPYNVEPDDQFSTAFPMRDIRVIFNRLDSRKLIFIADTCFSGNVQPGGRTYASSIRGITSEISELYLDRISEGKGRIILAASKADEVSREDDRLEHGIFTYYLLKGLNGKADYDRDGLISIEEISQYVKTAVPKATGNRQHPVQRGETIGEVILGKIKR